MTKETAMFDFDLWLSSRPVRLVHGAGSPDTGGCWMSALSLYSGDRWSDHPACVDGPTRRLCIAINDMLPDDESRGRVIGPRLLDPVGTVGDADATERRLWILVDAAVRIWAPLALDASGRKDHAARLRALPETTRDNGAAARATSLAADAAEAAAYASADAAEAAAYASAPRAYARAASLAAAEAAASRAAADAAALAAYADAARAADARERFVVTHMIPVLDRMLAVGSRVPVEMRCEVAALDRCVQRAVTQ
jgi:hypothetical protein